MRKTIHTVGELSQNGESYNIIHKTLFCVRTITI